jgi:predicted ATPase/DNA-binding SARP family transcriptional activator
VEIRVLGPFEVVVDGRPVTLPRRRARALLAFLALHANEVVARDTLIDVLWPERPPDTAEHSIHVYVSEARKTLRAAGLPDALRRAAAGYLLEVGARQLDVRRFEELVERGKRALEDGDAAAAAAALTDALALWRGQPLAELAGDGFARVEIGRLEEMRLGALEDRIEADLALARHAELVSELEHLAAANPFRERIHGQLMLALYRCGRQADALSAYAGVRQGLVDELGLEPSRELRQLQTAILRQEPSLDVHSPALRDRLHLPAPVTPFIGRQWEQAELRALLADEARLVTVTGPGGIGKTRLALEVAAALVGRFADGVYFVDLAAVRDPQLVAAAIARSLGVRERSDTPLADSVKRHLRDRRALLVVDNFEQVLDGAVVVGELLAEAGGLKVLATSREVLRLYGEHDYALGQLGLPDVSGSHEPEAIATADSVALFVARARAARRDFDLTSENARLVAEICTLLDGLPLALELAAAHVRRLSPAALLAGLEPRLDILADGPRDAPARQQTMRAAIEWSYDLLDLESRRIFSSCSIFDEGWTEEAAREVCGADEETLEALVERNLIRIDGARFSMLETIRDFASERLANDASQDVLGWRHAEHFVSLAERAELGGADQSSWLDLLETEHANLRAALGWVCGRADSELGLRLGSALFQFWYMRGYVSEGLDWLEQVLTLSRHAPAADRARVLRGAGILAAVHGDYSRASRLLTDAVRIHRRLGDARSLARCLNNLGSTQAYAGDLDRAHSLLEESLQLYRGLDDRDGIAQSVLNLSDVALRRGGYAEAAALAADGFALAEELGNGFGAAIALQNQGLAAFRTGRLADASRLLRRRIELSSDLGDREGIAAGLDGLAAVAASSADPERASVLLGAGEALRDAAGIVLARFERELHEQTTSDARAQLGPDRMATAWERGRRMTLGDMTATALQPEEDADPPAHGSARSASAAGTC